jgi:hypothetical protein
MAANKGSKHHASKMTEATVRAARKSFENGSWIMLDGKRTPVSTSSLARKYGVSHQTMDSLLRRETWKHVQ